MTSSATAATSTQEWRFERKMLVEGLPLWRAEAILRHHPALFRPLYEARYVNNIYFDGVGERAYHDNIEGVAERIKVRIRWYGELLGECQPTLELKIKRGLVGRKETCSLPGLRVRRGMTAREVLQLLRKAELPDSARRALQGLEPVLVNRYRRRYFRSGDAKFRLTLDDAQEFWGWRAGIAAFASGWKDRDVLIFELKYAPEHDAAAREVSGWFPFRVTRSSKYVRGLELVRS